MTEENRTAGWGERRRGVRSVRKEMREVKRQLIELEAFKSARFNSLVEGPEMPGCRRQWGIGPWEYQVAAYATYRLVDTGRRDEMEREMGFDPDSERALEAEHAATRTRLLGEDADSFWHPEADARLQALYGERLEPYDYAVRYRERGLLAQWNARFFDVRRRAEVWHAGWWAASYEVVERNVGHIVSPISKEDWLWLGVPDDELLRGSMPLPSWSGVAEIMTDEDMERERWCIEVIERLEERRAERRHRQWAEEHEAEHLLMLKERLDAEEMVRRVPPKKHEGTLNGYEDGL